MNEHYTTTMKRLLALILFLLPCLSQGQNIVLNVTGKVLVDGQPVKKGDNLNNHAKPVFKDPVAELKLLTQAGVCVIKHKNYEQNSTSELLELIKNYIRKNSIATLGTRTWKVNPTKDEQVKLVETLCRTLNISPDNVHEMFSRYITPYCVLEFERPYWQDIARLLKTRYGFNPPQLTGELMTQEEYQSIPLVPQVRSLKPIPQAASLRKYCPIPGDQGRYGTCTGWASTYSARTISWAVKNNLTDVSDITNQAFSPSFVYYRIKDKDDDDCQFGASINKSVEVLKRDGAVFLTDLPYQCNPDLVPFYKQAKAYVIKDFQRLTTKPGIISDADFNNIKRALSANKPVLGTIKCYKSFLGSWGNEVWNGEFDSMEGYHAICLVGYDDNYENGDGSKGAMELMNSWGTTWGDGGYIRIKYKDFPKILDYAISMYDDVLPVPPPEPPKPGPVPPPAPDILKRMEGSFALLLSDGTAMPIEGDEAVFRNFKLVSAEKMTYNISGAYPTGTMFRIQFTSSQPAYIYVISTDSKRSPIALLFPDPEQNISALLDFKSEVSVSIPDETQYIQMDETSGDDYLCVIYSKEELNMDAIKNSFQNDTNKSFVTVVKEVLANRMVTEKEVVFEKNRIAFQAASADHTAIPIFIKIKHR